MMLVPWDARSLEHSHGIPPHVVVRVTDSFADGPGWVDAGEAPHQDQPDGGVEEKYDPQLVDNSDVLEGRPFG